MYAEDELSFGTDEKGRTYVSAPNGWRINFWDGRDDCREVAVTAARLGIRLFSCWKCRVEHGYVAVTGKRSGIEFALVGDEDELRANFERLQSEEHALYISQKETV